MTKAQLEDHEESGHMGHVPTIVHRLAGPSAEKLNACGIFGAWITLRHGYWAEVDDATAEAMLK